ncbi:MAG: hypothetical protein CM15mP119_2020 [Alphaproteobacteria bacterium]|nr:MAG: hypothetical protein CM15mP119_2020 [Alphaproteobacteria bacterium]
MSSLFDVGKSALTSYRQSLAVTGQNIANINTEGYKRREAKLEEVTGSQGGVTSLPDQTGLGVRVTDINRSFDQYFSGPRPHGDSQFENWMCLWTSSNSLKICCCLIKVIWVRR